MTSARYRRTTAPVRERLETSLRFGSGRLELPEQPHDAPPLVGV
jgi:hypothetical protein